MNNGASPRRDHSSNFFYQVSNDNYMYKRSADTQQTDPQSLTKTARNYYNNNASQMNNSPKAGGSPSRINFTMQTKYFHHSNVFDGLQQQKDYQQAEQPIKNRDNKSPCSGAQINKNYNCTVGKNQPIVNNTKQITMDFQIENNNFDAIDLKRSLLKQGIQVADIQMKNPINSGRTKNMGSLTIRGNDLSQVENELEKVGIKVNNKPNNHYVILIIIQKQQANHNWLLQKQKYDKIEYFKNR
ncbi:hypothetical protein FGO68_gene17404 [Halteria grandinella]|uniref:Uncharacterized protein n=1 Tax=Halteria grandinella TaxID=5974 RepID=A0A8J8SXW3_HALGN|nr:hypothetical protein FGO68_gene17404 [Halteria grandinella]